MRTPTKDKPTEARYAFHVNDVDWTGVDKRPAQVAPLTAETFVARLKLLSTRAHDIQLLRQTVEQSKGRPQDLLDVTELKQLQKASSS